MNSRLWAALALAFLLSCHLFNQPPAAPANPLGPGHGSVRDPVNFTSSAFDPDGDDVAIRFAWGDKDTSPWSSFVTSGQSVTASHLFSSLGFRYVRAQAKDTRNAVSNWSGPTEVRVTRPDANRPPSAPTAPSGPAGGAYGDMLSFTTSATDPDDGKVAIRFSWGDADTSTWSSLVPCGSNVTAKHAYTLTGPRLVRAQARDPWDSVSAWSKPTVVAITPPASNHPPLTPATPTGPIKGDLGRVLKYTASAVDPDGDAVAIRFAWGQGDTSEWSSLTASGTSVTDTHTYTSVGSASVWAQARDSWYSQSGWSAPLAVSIRATIALEIRGYGDYTEPYPYGGLWGFWFWGQVVNTTSVLVDNATVRAKINWSADTLLLVVADSLRPGGSAEFSWGQLGWGPGRMESIRATGELRP